MVLVGELKNSEKDLSQHHFVHHKFHWTDPGMNLSCHMIDYYFLLSES
jgi:hypothetical protein